MKTIAYALLALLGCNIALANSNFVSNPRLPYPPACAHIPDADAAFWLADQAVKFYDQEIQVYDAQVGEQIPLGLKVYRSPCSEPGRSLVWLQFSLSATYSGRQVEFQLPTAWAEITNGANNFSVGMRLAAEPNGWGTESVYDRAGTYLVSKPRGHAEYFPEPGQRNWVFLLDDGDAALDEWWYWNYWMTASAYNAGFKLSLGGRTIEIPPTTVLLPTPALRLPLSGRQSGTWVIEGAADQGFQISISDQVRAGATNVPGAPDLPLVIFLTQYTFDTDGNMLWLTGAAQFEPGATKVTIPVEKVTNGEFRGGKRAEREIVGSVTITSNNCNDLGFEYDYGSLGLGQGLKRLQRIYSLETAGYECRDYEARVAANQ